MSPRKRTAMIRYDPKLMKALRAEMSKCPNPVFGQMSKEGEMRPGDMVDFALTLAHSYFDGTLLKSCEATQRINLQMQMCRAVLVTAAFFDATATFDEDGTAFTSLQGADDDTRLAAVQALLDVGLGLKEALASFPGPQGHLEERVQTRIQEQELVH